MDAVMIAKLQPMLDHVMPWALVVFRIAGVLMLTPLLTSAMIPARAKALMAAMLGSAAYPMLSRSLPPLPEVDVIGLIPMILAEVLIGFVMGAIASLPLLMMELAGVLGGTTMGMGIAKVYNPETDFDVDLLGQLLFFIATSLFLTMGGLDGLFSAVLHSFERVPLGGFLTDHQPLGVFVGVLSSGFELGLRVAAPIVAIIFAMIIVLGLLGKTMPQLNVMSVGFSVKLLAGLAVLAWSLYAIREPLTHEIDFALRSAVRWFEGPIERT
jgi:flagellar biosynthesis protein FliR